ncbi:MAG: YdbH domain-containing protein [Desulfurivibrio sp.]|nr:YdbH domain-containing protein [Desulfurivibrio sp.]
MSGDHPGTDDHWPEVVLSGELAPIAGWLQGGEFKLKLGPASDPSSEAPDSAGQTGKPGGRASFLQGHLQVSLQPDLAATTHPNIEMTQLTIEATGLVSPALDHLTTTRAIIHGEFKEHPGLTLEADLDLKRESAEPAAFTAELKLATIDLANHPQLPALLPGWPPLLSLEAGRLDLELELTRAAGRLSGSGRLELRDAAGVYDTAFFRGLHLKAPFTLEPAAAAANHAAYRQATGPSSPTNPEPGATMFATTIDLAIAELNPGIALASVEAALDYRAPLNAPGRGRLLLKELTAQLLGGQVRARPLILDPTAEPPTSESAAQTPPAAPDAAGLQPPRYPYSAGRLTLEVAGLDLYRLLLAHPVQGLHGDGLIDGLLPLQWGPEGVTIEAGHLQARTPGGQLRYTPRGAEALARRNPTLKLVLDALADFNYNTLLADLDYHRDGTLEMALRLEGANPDFEKGRPIHLELNLEENIPQLLATLQLGNRISDTIRQRIEEQYR